MRRQLFLDSADEALSTRRLNLERKTMKCLGCGREMRTDRCHRFCRVCVRRNRRAGYYAPRRVRLPDLRIGRDE